MAGFIILKLKHFFLLFLSVFVAQYKVISLFLLFLSVFMAVCEVVLVNDIEILTIERHAQRFLCQQKKAQQFYYCGETFIYLDMFSKVLAKVRLSVSTTESNYQFFQVSQFLLFIFCKVVISLQNLTVSQV